VEGGGSGLNPGDAVALAERARPRRDEARIAGHRGAVEAGQTGALTLGMGEQALPERRRRRRDGHALIGDQLVERAPIEPGSGRHQAPGRRGERRAHEVGPVAPVHGLGDEDHVFGAKVEADGGLGRGEAGGYLARIAS